MNVVISRKKLHSVHIAETRPMQFGFGSERKTCKLTVWTKELSVTSTL